MWRLMYTKRKDILDGVGAGRGEGQVRSDRSLEKSDGSDRCGGCRARLGIRRARVSARRRGVRLRPRKAGQTIVAAAVRRRGEESPTHRAGCWLTAIHGDVRNRPQRRVLPPVRLAARVKRGNLHPEQSQIGRHRGGPLSLRVGSWSRSVTVGLEEWLSRVARRQAGRAHRIRLIGLLCFFPAHGRARAGRVRRRPSLRRFHAVGDLGGLGQHDRGRAVFHAIASPRAPPRPGSGCAR